MRVLFFHNSSDLYGASRSLLRLATELVQRGHDVHVAVPADGILCDELRTSGCTLHVMKHLGVLDRIRMQTAIGVLSHGSDAIRGVIETIRLIRSVEPDVAHTNVSVIYSGAVASWLLRVPHVWHVRENYEGSAAARLYLSLISALSRQVITISSFVASQFGERHERKLLTVFNGLPPEAFDTTPAEHNERVACDLHLSGKYIILCVGRLKVRRKGQETLVRAVAQLKDSSFPNGVACLLVGSAAPGNEQHGVALRQLANQLGVTDEVIFVGDVDDVRPYYSLSDVVVMPSGIPEPFGNVVVEAMAQGVPVIASAAGGPLDQIRDGEDGLLFEPGNVDDLVQCLRRLMNDAALSRCLGAEGRRTASTRFALKGTADRIEAVYRSITDAK